MTRQKKIWELQDTTICKVVGMALNVEDLRRIFRKFGLRSQDKQLDETFVIHSAIVRTCGEENKISRHIQKLIEKRFSGYEKRLGQQDLREIRKSRANRRAVGLNDVSCLSFLAQEAYLNNHWRFNAKSKGRSSLADFNVL